MKRFLSKLPVRTLFLLGLVVLTSSCNRGYGCPTNFALDDILTRVLHTLIQLIA